jgi:alanine racemase
MTALTDATESRNAWIEVDLDALDANVVAVRRAVGGATELIAVVKANAYGAGVEGLAPALEEAGVDRFAVVWPAEGVALRRSGVGLPIIVLGHAFAADAALAVAHDLTLTCHSLELGNALSAAAQRAGRPARVHLKVDTGMHRFGITVEETIALAEHLRRLPGIEVEGLTTHMANADEPDDGFSDVQYERFATAAARLPWVRYRHTANSATALRRQELRYEGVRVGLALHGAQPDNTPGAGLTPILALKARVARVTEIAPGEGVSYGLRWRASRPSRVALVPVGYGDGWRRSLGNRGEVLIGGKRRPMVGTLCMDQFLADVTDLPPVAEGDEVVLLGQQASETITASEIAALTGTIAWDVFASLQARLPRIYHRGGRVERVTETGGSGAP